MKKLILAGIIGAIFSGVVVAAEETNTQEEGVRFNTAVGPFYDPIFDFAISVIPTLTYEIGDATKTSTTSLYAIYGTNGNWVGKVNSTNYLGDNNDWKLFGDATYTYAKLDVMNFMRFGKDFGSFVPGFAGMTDAPVVEVEQNTIRIEGDAGYQIIDDLYVGPSYLYVQTEFERDDPVAYGSVNMITDKDLTAYGIKIEYDKRSNRFTPTNGMYFSVNAQTVEVENTKGAVVDAPALGPGVDGMTLNGTDKYDNIKADLRFYVPIGDNTTFAWRGATNWNSSDAPKTLATLDSVAGGFTMEIAGQSSYGTDFQIRHYLTKEFGVVGGIALAKAQDVGTGGDDSVHYAGTLGLRYMLAPEDGLSMRLDFAYNDQEDDNIVAFFNVGETF